MNILGVSKTKRSKPTAVMIAVIWATGLALYGGAANACETTHFQNDGRYAGGDLPTQIAAKANTIQIVRVKAKRLVSRTYAEGEWYLTFGDTNVPEGTPEFLDQLVFELEPLETLKGGGDTLGLVYGQPLRVRGFGPEVVDRGVHENGENARHPNALPVWLPDRPGNGGYPFAGASEYADLGGGDCNAPYVLEVGQTLLALRDSDGRLYSGSGFPLEIDVEFLIGDRKTDQWSLSMQSLIPINVPEDAFVARLRQALAAGSNTTRN